MYGFSESFNISVSAAICLYDLTTRMRTKEEIDWMISKSEKNELLLDWLTKSIKAGDQLVQKWRKDNQI